MAATDERVQAYVDNQMRPHCEVISSAVIQLDYDKATIGDVYEACNAGSPTWSDTNTNNVPLTPADVLAFNSFITDVAAYCKAHASWPVVQKALRNSPV